ncbi:MAG: PH domain-containing protein [Eggerthellaceae bacterium]|jgi:putative membrane protein
MAEYPSTFRTGRAYRVHHSYIWLMPLNAALAVAAVLLANVAQNFVELYAWLNTSGMDIGIVPFVLLAFFGVLAVVYALAAVLHAWSYKHLWYEFDEREFSLYSGIFSKKRVHVPYARVQSVNHKAGILQRVFGVCTVMVDTAGGSSNKEIRIPYVELGVGERIRTELFVRKAAALAGEEARLVYRDPSAAADAAAADGSAPAAPVPPESEPAAAPAPNVLDDAAAGVIDWRGAFGGSAPGMEPERYRFGLTNKELFLASASHSVAVGVSATLGVLGLFGMALSNVAGLVLFTAFLTLVLIGWVAGMVPVVLRYGGFATCRRGSRIEVEQGLLQRRYTGIDVARVQSVVIRQSFVRRWMGYCEVSLGRIDAASTDSSGNSGQLNAEGLVIHPFVKMDRVDELLDGLLPEFADRPRQENLVAVAPVALRRGLIRRCIWCNPALYCAAGLLAAQLAYGAYVRPELVGMFSFTRAAIVAHSVDQAFLLGYVLCAAATACAVVGTVLWRNESGFALNRSFACIFNSGLSTEFVLVPRQKIQFGYTRSNPFQRLAHTSSLNMVTAAGVNSTRTRLYDVRREDAEAWLLWMEPHGAARADGRSL